MSDYHEYLTETVQIIFDQVLEDLSAKRIKKEDVENIITEYLDLNLDRASENILYVKSYDTLVNFLDVSQILDDLAGNKRIIEKCCKYDKTNDLFLVVLLIQAISDSNE